MQNLSRTLQISSPADLDHQPVVDLCPLDQSGHDVKGGCCRHTALLPAFNRPSRYSAEIRESLSGQSGLVSDRLDSLGVVHDLAAIREDDGLAVGASTVGSGNSHGLQLVGEISRELVCAEDLIFRAARLIISGVVRSVIQSLDVILSCFACLKSDCAVALACDERPLIFRSIKAAGLADNECGGGSGSGHFVWLFVRGLIASTPARYAGLRNRSTSFYAKVRNLFLTPKTRHSFRDA